MGLPKRLVRTTKAMSAMTTNTQITSLIIYRQTLSMHGYIYATDIAFKVLAFNAVMTLVVTTGFLGRHMAPSNLKEWIQHLTPISIRLFVSFSAGKRQLIMSTI